MGGRAEMNSASVAKSRDSIGRDQSPGQRSSATSRAQVNGVLGSTISSIPRVDGEACRDLLKSSTRQSSGTKGIGRIATAVVEYSIVAEQRTRRIARDVVAIRTTATIDRHGNRNALDEETIISALSEQTRDRLYSVGVRQIKKVQIASGVDGNRRCRDESSKRQD